MIKKWTRAVMFGILSGVLAAGCASTPDLPPKESPEEVELYFPGSYPTEEYKVVATITERRSLGTDDDELIAAARARAARLGADALLIRALRRTTEGEVATDLSREEEKILEAIAVYYPSRHPQGQ
jgi:hypothetical protein